jgi:hypothetical protein
MKINKSNKKINRLAIIIAIVLVATVGYTAVAYFAKLYPFNNHTAQTQKDSSSKKVNEVNYDQPSSDQQQAGTQAKKESEERALNPDTSTPEGSTQLAITSYNQENGTLELRTTISTANESGKCSLVFKKSGSTTITQEVGVQNMGSYGVCMGFDIPTSGLAKGDWTAEITYTGPTPSATVSQVIKIE